MIFIILDAPKTAVFNTVLAPGLSARPKGE